MLKIMLGMLCASILVPCLAFEVKETLMVNSSSLPPVDYFGIKQLFTSVQNGPQWDSRHWNSSTQRILDSSKFDPLDPSRVSQGRGSSNPMLIDGKGTMILQGSQPRMYLNKPQTHFFVNVEATVYYKRIRTDGEPFAGLVLGARTHSKGHSIQQQFCLAQTYYARLRHDGFTDFEKELKHPASSVRSRKLLFPGRTLPSGVWFGFKFIIRNNGNGVQLIQYLDKTGGRNGGTWEKINEYIDSGNWKTPATNCQYRENFISLRGNGIFFLRNTNVRSAEYKWMSVREIADSN